MAPVSNPVELNTNSHCKVQYQDFENRISGCRDKDSSLENYNPNVRGVFLCAVELMGCVCSKSPKADGPRNGPGSSQDQNHALPHASTVSPQDVTPTPAVNKPPPPAVPPKKREW